MFRAPQYCLDVVLKQSVQIDVYIQLELIIVLEAHGLMVKGRIRNGYERSTESDEQERSFRRTLLGYRFQSAFQRA
jgi:hypothetical protein